MEEIEKAVSYMKDYAGLLFFFQCPSDDHIKDGRTCEGDGEVCI